MENTEPEKFQYQWGARAENELDKLEVLQFVSRVRIIFFIIYFKIIIIMIFIFIFLFQIKINLFLILKQIYRNKPVEEWTSQLKNIVNPDNVV